MLGNAEIYRQPDGVFIVPVGYRIGRLAGLPAMGWKWGGDPVALWSCSDPVKAHASARDLGLEVVPHPEFGEAS